MPIPEPSKGESEKDYISRGMANSLMKKEFPENKKRLAVLYSQWRKQHGGKKPSESKMFNSLLAD